MSLKEEAARICRELENPGGAGYVVIFKDLPWYNPQTKKTEMRCYIEKHIDNLSKPVGIARAEHFEQYPRQYEAYLKAKREKESGTSLQLLPALSPADIENCMMNGIYTIEKLAEAPKDVIMKIGDESLPSKAASFLKGESEKDLEIERLKKQLEGLRNDSSNDSSGHSGRDTAVRGSNKRTKQQQQGSASSPELLKDGQ